jgi:hypothetical protein
LNQAGTLAIIKSPVTKKQVVARKITLASDLRSGFTSNADFVGGKTLSDMHAKSDLSRQGISRGGRP